MNQTAQGLASFGRGPDSMLVHMAPSEVKSLQQLAMAHGGSLTINPQTGLPEAGFLSSLLPMLIGGGLSIVSGGTLTPLMASLMTGGGYAAATGSLKKGLMAGLGAYGGAGLGSALANAGAATAGDAAASGAFDSALSKQGLSAADAAMDFSNPLAEQAAAGARTAATSSNLNNLTAGFSGLGSEAGRNAFMSQIGGGKGLLQAGAMAAAPMLLEPTTKQPEIKTDTDIGQQYKFDPGTITPTPTSDEDINQNFGKQIRYFNPRYTPIDNDAAKKLYGRASGGPVEDMSNANAIGMNTGYPQAAIDTGAYATPYQQPISRNVVTGSQGAGVDPYTGQAQFAEGGEVDEYTYDPITQLYTKKGGQGATTVAPIKSISEVREGPGGGSERGATSNNPGGVNTKDSLVNSILSSAMVGRVGNFLGSKQDPTNVTVEDRAIPGTPATVGFDNSVEGSSGYGKTASGGIDGSMYSKGGISHLGDYSDGGRLLRGPGDGISDSIPAMIGKKQPARLADGEFVVPARIVSELGNGSTEAGARKLYAMMDRVQKARGKTVGKGKVATNSRSAKYLPA